jgi:hypothetical protein
VVKRSFFPPDASPAEKRRRVRRSVVTGVVTIGVIVGLSYEQRNQHGFGWGFVVSVVVICVLSVWVLSRARR